MLTHGATLCRPHAWAQIIGSPMASGFTGILLSRWRVVKSTPVALVKLRGAQLNQARGGRWLNHLAGQGGEGGRRFTMDNLQWTI